MTGSNLPNPQDKGAQPDEPTPVTPAPVEASPSSTGVVAGEGDEPEEARPPQS